MLGLVRTEPLGSFQIRLANDGYTRPTGHKAAGNLQALTLWIFISLPWLG
jgi:hypothetical protein